MTEFTAHCLCEEEDHRLVASVVTRPDEVLLRINDAAEVFISIANWQDLAAFIDAQIAELPRFSSTDLTVFEQGVDDPVFIASSIEEAAEIVRVLNALDEAGVSVVVGE